MKSPATDPEGDVPPSRPGAKEPAVFKAWIVSRSAPWILGLIFGIITPLCVFAPLLLYNLGDTVFGTAMVTGVVLCHAAIAAALWEAYSRVSVGRDGVLVRRRFTTHYFAFVDLAEVAEVGGVALRLTLRSGETVDLYTGKDEHLSKPKYVAACEQLCAKIRAGIERHREAGAGDAEADALHCRAQAVLHRTEPVAKVPYRAQPAPSDGDLWRVVEEETQPPAARAAAAVLLNESSTAEVRSRLRIAAEGTVHPELRKVLRIAVEEGEAHDLRAAFEQLEEEQQRRAAEGAR